MNVIRSRQFLISLVVILLGVTTFLIVSHMMEPPFQPLSDAPVPLAGGVILDLDTTAKEYTGAAPENKSGTKPGIQIPGYGSITIPANATDVKIMLLNPEANPCYFTFEIVLKDTGDSLYQSKLVEPSKCIEQITLAKALEKGEYSATIKVRTYELESLIAMNNADVEVKLIVV